jgi:uncharacterized protein (TIGR02996 family)
MSMLEVFAAWIKQSRLTQREKLEQIRAEWIERLTDLPDAEIELMVRAVKKAVNSKKLKAERELLVAELQQIVAARPPRPAAEQAAVEAEPAPGEAAPAVLDPEEAALVAAIAADPEARAPYLVYADWLQSRGDPRGELIVIQHELSKSPGNKKMLRAAEELLEAHAAEILGPLAECMDLLEQVDWYMGFIRACKLRQTMDRFDGDLADLPVEQVLAGLLQGPGRFIQRLTVGIVRMDDNNYGGVCEVIGAQPRPTLRALYLGDFDREETELNWSSIGDASPLYAALPNLRELTLRSGGMTLGAIELPELRAFTTVTGGLDDAAARAIAAASWPKLERLSLQFGPARAGDATNEVEVVRPLLAGAGLQRLTHLGITNCDFTDAVCAALPGAAILPRLEQLDLCMGSMSDAGAEALAAHREAFSRLKLLDVDDNFLTTAGLQLLEGICAEVRAGDQRTADDEPAQRYASAYE